MPNQLLATIRRKTADVVVAGRSRVRPRYLRARRAAADALVWSGRPIVSIVVPVYNVEDYLDACLRSIVHQTFRRIEVILVDDGSTDGSTEIAKRWARENRQRIRYVHQQNKGLGGARNTGVELARGQYLMFVDSDDTITRDAVQVMYQTLQRTGSDFVCGSTDRIDNGKRRTPNWAARLHAQRQLSVTIADRPDMVENVFAWGKLYRMDFWRRLGEKFPEHLYYEDQVPSARAYLAARAFDIIPETVYFWYLRTGTSSITQTTAQLRNLRDRITVTHEVNQILADSDVPDLRRRWLNARILGNDISLYVKDIDWVTDEYYAAIQEWLGGIFTDADWTQEFTAPPMKRLLAWSLLHRDRTVVEDLRQLERGNPGGLPTTVRAERVFVDLGDEWNERLRGAPEELFRIVDERLIITSSARRLRWVEPGVLEIVGWAYIRSIDLADNSTSIVVEVRDARGDELVASAQASPRPDLSVTRRTQSRWLDVDRSGFECRLDLRNAAERPGRLLVCVRVETAGIVRTSPLAASFAPGSSSWPLSSPPVAGVVLNLTWHEGRLLVSRRHVAAVVDQITMDAEDIVLACRLMDTAQTAPEWHVTKRTKGGLVRLRGIATRRSDSSYEVRFPASGFFRQGRGWRTQVTIDDRQQGLLMASQLPSLIELGSGVVAQRSARGNLLLVPATPMIWIDSSEIADRSWTVTGMAVACQPEELRLVGARHSLMPDELSSDGNGTFRARFPLTISEWGDPARDVAPSRYRLKTIGSSKALVRWSDAGLTSVPTEFIETRYSIKSNVDRIPVLEIDPLIGGDGVGLRYQRLLQEQIYEPARTGSRSPCILFESFQGRNATCNTLAIFEELKRRDLDLQWYWSVTDTSVWTPPGATPIVRLSEDWYRILGSAACLVNNTNFPPIFRKGEGQIYLQTWHGTPLKKIGHDVGQILFSYRNYLEMMDREATLWDALISPNAFSTEIFPHAFAYDGKLLETGYPRNDQLLNRPAELAARARERLGLAADGRKVLLYAPTWRDDKFKGKPGRYQAVYFLDFEEFTDALGEDYVVLVRGHSNTILFGKDVRHEAVIDATRYPEIADLYALADVLVTDYSSVMFDYSVTGKPMAFLAPDIADYRDRVRGFYFDFEAEAPGPITLSTKELIEEVADLSAMTKRHRAAYARFRERFNLLEDGHASERVVDWLIQAAGL